MWTVQSQIFIGLAVIDDHGQLTTNTRNYIQHICKTWELNEQTEAL